MSSALYRLGRWCFRRRRYVLATWLLVIVVLGVVAINVKQSTTNSVLSFLPIILLGILFGLAMDYEVFLESRMREESLHKDPTSAATDGYTGSAKVVASAAIIMIAVFASFIFSPDPTTKSLGFALALGVLIDAFVIRMTAVPATMYIFKGCSMVVATLDASCSTRPGYRGKQTLRSAAVERCMFSSTRIPRVHRPRRLGYAHIAIGA